MQLLPTMLRRTGDMASRSRTAMIDTITEIASADNIKVCGSWLNVLSFYFFHDITIENKQQYWSSTNV